MYWKGRVIGVTIGCLLGMTPLLWLHNDTKDKDDKEIKGGEKKEGKKEEKWGPRDVQIPNLCCVQIL